MAGCQRNGSGRVIAIETYVATVGRTVGKFKDIVIDYDA
jgi:hypothetical protein